MDKLIGLLGSGWKGYVGVAIVFFGAMGLLADFFGQYIGFDAIPGQVTTWAEVDIAFGLLMALLGIRHKQDVAQKATVQAQQAMVETQEEIIEDMEKLPQKKGSK